MHQAANLPPDGLQICRQASCKFASTWAADLPLIAHSVPTYGWIDVSPLLR